MRGLLWSEPGWATPPTAPADIYEAPSLRQRDPTPRVLVIEDDPCLRLLIAERFENSGYIAFVAENGEVGTRVFYAEEPELVVTDIVMPEKDGIATIIELKRFLRPPRIIAISGGGRISSRDCLKWARHLGADETMLKPFPMSALIAAAGALLERPATHLI